MADLYDIVEELTLPIYGGNFSTASNESITFENGTPVIAITVPVYLYYGSEDDFDPSRADGDLIPNSLRRAASLVSDNSVHIILAENENVGSSYYGLYRLVTLNSENEINWEANNILSAVPWDGDVKVFCLRTLSGQYLFLRYRINSPEAVFPFSSQFIMNETPMLTAANYYGDVQFPDTPEPNPNPYNPGGTSGIGGGGGNFGQDDRNDNVSADIPGGSNFGYIGGSIFTHYALSGSQAKHFGEWLWTDDLGLSLWKTVMEKLFNETADALVSLMCFPFNISTLPGVSLGEGNIIAGNLNTGIPARSLGSPYASINWGIVTLNEYWGNFLDYAPHTKLELYLPWSTGFVPLDPHQCVPGSVSVTTNIDLQKGTCTHNVFAGNTVLGVYEGQCGYEVPLLASNFSAKLAGATVAAVATAVTAGAAAAVGGASAIAGSKAMSQVASHNSMIKSMMPGTARNMAGLSGPMTDPGMLASKNFLESQLQMASAPSPIDYSPISHGVGSKIASASSSATAKQPVNISRNGSFSGSSAGMSVPYPFIVISRPEQNVPSGYGHHFGYPSNITSILGQLKGYTEVGAIHLNGLKALPDEIAELDGILKGGFII